VNLRLLIVPALLAAMLHPCRASSAISFAREILPILSDNCFACHGPDENRRKAKLRLDLRDEATRLNDGLAAVTPGKPGNSLLIQRINSPDPDEQMPPPDSHKTLSASEKQLLSRWIAQGAPWATHWAFDRPVRIKTDLQGEHPVDHFVRRQLRAQSLEPSPPASRRTLLRRLSFDLTGLPPTPEEVESFVNDRAPDAYERRVDSLLASPHYGERMAMWWLDAARYSDTDGFQGDATRSNWPWRDWVIDSFNRNQPFDQFTVEQFAGDLLPSPGPDQILATCFHRNHMTNGEGGRDPEESRVDYVIDRVNTTGTLWLGLTVGCAQCHSHKFDPIRQTEYYSLSAFFNSIDEDGRAGQAAKPYYPYRSPYAIRALEEARDYFDQQSIRHTGARRAGELPFEQWLQTARNRVAGGFEPWTTVASAQVTSTGGTRFLQESDGVIQTSGPTPRQDDYRMVAHPALSRITGIKLEVFPHPSHTDGKFSRGSTGEFILTNIKLQAHLPGRSQVREIPISGAVADVEAKPVNGGPRYGLVKDTLDDDPRNGWTTRGHDAPTSHIAQFALEAPLILAPDEELVLILMHRSTLGDANIGRFRVSLTDQPAHVLSSLQPMPLEELAAIPPGSASGLPDALRQRLFEQFLTDEPAYQEIKADLDRARAHLADTQNAAGDVSVMVLAEREKPRETHVLERGVWDRPGELVPPAVLSAVLPWSPQATRTRLDLARWITSTENPLTARVIVNHLWQLTFGAGLVRTPDDFGLQGEQPTHPELLDWLALEFMETGWDIKHMLRLFVLSDTYQQSSRVSPALLELDPGNRFLARSSRHRLPSWMLHDAALKSGGLFNPAIGGPPVRPFQPAGVWKEMFMGRFQYEPSPGPARYRRTIYTFWRRSSAPAFLFDSPQRRVCEVRTRRTNTPLQALTMLNDGTLLEASHRLARRALDQTPTARGRIQFLMQHILLRSGAPEEVDQLAAQLDRALEFYRAHPEQALQFLTTGPMQPDRSVDPASHAAVMLLASTCFNLDESMNHE
jgi:hypothetical protein